MTDHDRIETDLHDAVQSYGTSIMPADRLGEIRRATRERRRVAWQRPWVLVAGAAVTTAAVVVGAMALAGPDPTNSGAPVAGSDQRVVTVYEARDIGNLVWLYPEQVSVPSTDDAVYDATLALLGDGSKPWADDRWVGCPLGKLESVQVSNHTVTLSMSGPIYECDMEPRYAQASMQQLAWTIHDAVGPTSSLVVENDGQPVITQPLTADPYARSPILLDSPADGATVSGPVTVEGRGDTFEGNVQWQVLQGDDVVEEGFETAGTMGEYGPFRFTVDLPPGDYTVRAFEMSAEDGSLHAEDTTTFTVE